MFVLHLTDLKAVVTAVRFMCACCSECQTTWRHNRTRLHCESEEAETDRGALPSKGVRLEPPFFPSSPCCEYCFRRFWALRMVPGPINTETESRGGGGGGSEVQRAKKQKKEEEEEKGRARKWNTDTTTETGSRGFYVGGGAQPSTTATPQDDQVRDRN